LNKHQSLSTENKKPRFFYGYVIVFVGFLVLALVGGATYTFGVFFKPLLADFGWTRAATSGAFSLIVGLHGVLAIITGRLTDKFGPRLLVTGCGLFMGTGFMLVAHIGGIGQLYMFHALVGIGVGGSYVPLMSVIARWFHRRRGLMTGIAVAGAGIGIAIVPPLASRLVAAYGWRPSYFIVGLLILVVITLAAQFLRRDPSQKGLLPYGGSEVESESLNPETSGLYLPEVIRTRQFWMLTVSYLSFCFAGQAVMVHIVPHATDLGIHPLTAANILAIIGGLGVLGRIGIGTASDRIGNKRALVISFVLVSAALLWLLAAGDLWMFYLFSAIFALGYGALMVLISPAVAEFFGMRAHGTILGVIVFGCAIGELLGPIVTGRIYDVVGSYNLAFVVCAVLCITSIILSSLLKPVHREVLIT
jgi:MFS family permease